ncbi:hypothetical protein V1521DRAFT_449617 [Lipomyces starkeyi]
MSRMVLVLLIGRPAEAELARLEILIVEEKKHREQLENGGRGDEVSSGDDEDSLLGTWHLATDNMLRLHPDIAVARFVLVARLVFLQPLFSIERSSSRLDLLAAITPRSQHRVQGLPWIDTSYLILDAWHHDGRSPTINIRHIVIKTYYFQE